MAIVSLSLPFPLFFEIQSSSLHRISLDLLSLLRLPGFNIKRCGLSNAWRGRRVKREHSAILTDQWESFYAKDSAALGARVLGRSPAPARRGASYGSGGNRLGRGAGAETTSRVSAALACLF